MPKTEKITITKERNQKVYFRKVIEFEYSDEIACKMCKGCLRKCIRGELCCDKSSSVQKCISSVILGLVLIGFLGFGSCLLNQNSISTTESTLKASLDVANNLQTQIESLTSKCGSIERIKNNMLNIENSLRNMKSQQEQMFNERQKVIIELNLGVVGIKIKESIKDY